jgi:hypothetical protein
VGENKTPFFSIKMSGVRGTYYSVAALPDTNARIPAMTLRPASTALLTIDSEDRFTDLSVLSTVPTPSSPYDFAISKSESLMAGFMTRIGISEVCFPWTIPNINAKTHTMLYRYSIAGGPMVTGTLNLPYGFYSPSQLATAINSALSSIVGLGFTMVYGTPSPIPVAQQTNLPRFSYSVTVGNSIAFYPLPYNSAAYPFPSTTKQLFNVLGFNYSETFDNPDSFGSYSLAQAIRYVDIVCNQLTNSQAQKDQTSQTVSRDMLCRLYVGGAPGVTSTVSASDPAFCPPGCAPTVLYRDFSAPKQIQWIPNQNIPGYLQFQVYDDTGQLLDSSINPPGFPGVNFAASDWSMTMLVTEN